MAAIRSRIADEFMPLIESLGEVESLLCAQTIQTIGVPLKFCKVIEQWRLHPLRLRSERLDGRFSRSAAQDDAVGFLAIGWQSRCLCQGVVVFTRFRRGTEPSSLITFVVWTLPSLKCCNHLHEVLGDEAPESNFPINDHGQGGRLHSTDRKFLVVDNRIGTRKIHADEPIGSASATGRVRQSIVLAPRTKLVEPLADGVRCQGRNPEPADRLSAPGRLIDVAEDQLPFAPGVCRTDDPRHPSGREDLPHHLELIFGLLVDDQWPLNGKDRQLVEVPLTPLRVDLVRLSQGNQVSDRPGDNVAVPLEIAFAPRAGSEDTGNVLRN